MAWPFINPASPASTDKVKFGDDVIRSGKSATITAFQMISNYQDNAGTVPALRTAVWATAGRPTGDDLVDRITGYNTDLGYEEYYDLATTSWKAKVGLPSWAVSGRPSSPFVGQIGYNTDLAVIERYSGSTWVRVSGDPRGKIDMWSGTVATIPAGWVLADGVQRTHPEGSTYTPPDLRNRFIVGAGDDSGTYTPGEDGIGTGNYAPGATGGEDKHKLIIAEMPNHNHKVGWSGTADGGTAGNVIKDDGVNTRNTSYTGGDGYHENRPPYYALCYLFKL